MDPDQALKDLGITEHNVRFTSTLCVDESRIQTKTAEKIYQLIKRFLTFPNISLMFFG